MTDGTAICHEMPSQSSIMGYTRLPIWLRDKKPATATAPRMACHRSSQGAEACGTTFFTQSADCESGYRVLLYEAVSSLD